MRDRYHDRDGWGHVHDRKAYEARILYGPNWKEKAKKPTKRQLDNETDWADILDSEAEAFTRDEREAA